MNYPKWIYPKEGPGFVVHSKEEHEALKGEFKESPADWVKSEADTSASVHEGRTYHEHMADWESKKDKAAVDAGKAEIPAEEIAQAAEPKRRGRHRKV